MKLGTPTKSELLQENEKLRESLRKTVHLARRTMWIAYVWNDHNFSHPTVVAKEECVEHGIASFDQANDFLDEAERFIGEKL